MPTECHHKRVAQQLRVKLGKKQFLRLNRSDITALLRQASGDPKIRIKKLIAAQLEDVLQEQDLRTYPTIQDTTTGNVIRLFRARSIVAAIVDAVAYPGETTDNVLKRILRLKGIRDLPRE